MEQLFIGAIISLSTAIITMLMSHVLQTRREEQNREWALQDVEIKNTEEHIKKIERSVAVIYDNILSTQSIIINGKKDTLDFEKDYKQLSTDTEMFVSLTYLNDPELMELYINLLNMHNLAIITFHEIKKSNLIIDKNYYLTIWDTIKPDVDKEVIIYQNICKKLVALRRKNITQMKPTGNIFIKIKKIINEG